MKCSAVFIILLAGMALNISFLLPVPFLPTMLSHEQTDLFYNGLIIACFSLSYIFSPSLLANHLLPSLGSVNTFVPEHFFRALPLFSCFS